MQHLISPGIILALLFTLVGAQVTRIVAPGRGPYAWTVVLAVVGLIAGELLALSGHLQGPAFGVLHPLPDAVAMAIAEATGVMVMNPPDPAEE